MAIAIDESTITIITTIATIVLGLVSKHFHTAYNSGKEALSKVSAKADLGAKLIRQIKDANEDNNISPEEFTGIVNTVDQIIESK